ncbi:hemicentin-1-like [Diaphorina citri]|uniref:Hemicentin-1-like n=1 Tax=Diaphorina citri TaxID=121845 RepID=A0A1S3D4J1_DIACI|nr:hemicentin-1-like [Diaphorina citri]
MYLVHLFVILCLLKFSQCYVKVVALNGTSLQKIEDDYQEAELFINNKYFNKLSEGPSSVRKHLGNDSTTKSPKKSRKKNKNRKNSKCSGEFGRGCPKPVDTKDPPDIQIETEVFQIEDDAIRAKNSILVQTTEDKDSTQLSSVEVTAINGTVLARLPLKPTPNNDGVYSGGPFVPYDDPCFIAITGKKYDEEHTSYPFKRISPTAFSPQNPESPRIEMASHQIEWIGSSAVLRCSVKSLVPFDVRWFKDGLVKSVNFHYEQSADVEFKIPNVTLASGGVYTCRANNIAGPASKKLRLQIKGLPPKVKAGLQKSGVSGQSVILTCSVTSSLPYNLTWLHVRSNFSSAQSRDIRNEARFITTTKNDLLISPVLPMDQGWYLCVANNSEGQSGSDKVMLTVQKKPQIKITSDTVEFKKNDDIVMSCFVLDGIPPPTLAWKKDGQFIKEGTPHVVRFQNLTNSAFSSLLSNMGRH